MEIYGTKMDIAGISNTTILMLNPYVETLGTYLVQLQSIIGGYPSAAAKCLSLQMILHDWPQHRSGQEGVLDIGYRMTSGFR